MKQTKKLDDPEIEAEIVRLYTNDKVPVTELARRYDVSPGKINRVLRIYNVDIHDRHELTTHRFCSEEIRTFAKECRRLLFKNDKSPNHEMWYRFNKLISDFVTDEHLTREQAYVKAAKEFPILHPLFGEYNIRDYDVDPNNVPGASPKNLFAEMLGKPSVVLENKEQSYLENLKWAMDAAGKSMAEKQDPTLAPNASAWYLYVQAKTAPRDFVMRMAQAEKEYGGTEETDERKKAKKSINEIDEYLKELIMGDDELTNMIKQVEEEEEDATP